jgi:hypothetical protein
MVALASVGRAEGGVYQLVDGSRTAAGPLVRSLVPAAVNLPLIALVARRFYREGREGPGPTADPARS